MSACCSCLLPQVLARIISSYGEDLVKSTLCLIEASRFGLLETELVELLAVDPVIPPVSGSKAERYSKTEDKIPMAKVSTLQPFLIDRLLVVLRRHTHNVILIR